MGTSNTEKVHNAYKALVKLHFNSEPRLPYPVYERGWYEWLKAGFLEEDLTLVFQWLSWHNKKKDYKYDIKITRFLDLENFGAWQEQATGWAEIRRKPKLDPNRVEVLRQSGREPELPKEKHVSEIFKAMHDAMGGRQ